MGNRAHGHEMGAVAGPAAHGVEFFAASGVGLQGLVEGFFRFLRGN